MASRLEYTSVGANRHPAAADWDQNILAFGADNNVALWCPLDPTCRGVYAILSGHTDVVNAVKWFPSNLRPSKILLSGASDGTLRIWCNTVHQPDLFRTTNVISEHIGAINAITVDPVRSLLISAAADATVRIYKLSRHSPQNENDETNIRVELLQNIFIQPKFLPLALASASIPSSQSSVLAVAGTKSIIQIYVSEGTAFKLSATLTGHDGWIRSLAFIQERTNSGEDLVLASASQDKFVRLWRLHQGENLPAISSAANDPALGALGKSLSNKAHRFTAQGSQYSVTFEALLLGHEDWIYSAKWNPQGDSLQLLTASADNSLSIWEPDPHSGVWICTTRLGEISAQKGATTATGSTGGFWTGLWSPNADAVASLGRTGSWRLWKSSGIVGDWAPSVSISGHIKGVQDLAWSKDGSVLLSTGSDQTTRLFAQWRHAEGETWHEFSRPQIHGYDLNCIDTTSNSQFISGADEKLLRVFDEPKAVATLLQRACGISLSTNSDLPDAANIPVLGLSNKAIESVDDLETVEPAINGDDKDREAVDPASVTHKPTLDFEHPPFEDHLARHMLWPETEKLYGHGYEISAVSATNDGALVATACKASSIDHAVIRIYETKDWREIKPPLTAHSLTVTSLSFSPGDRYLLSTGRDRQWTVFARQDDNRTQYRQMMCDQKGHSRMILAGSWAPIQSNYVFATAGRDKSVKIWALDADEGKATCKTTVSATSPVTAIHILPKITTSACRLVLAYGTEDGNIIIQKIGIEFTMMDTVFVAREYLPSKSVNQLRWRPGNFREDEDDASPLLASASEDCTMRIYRFDYL
ncbi:MAG: hypothetical protein M1820_001998 [Bogoriella megaspora]|nr:MAG: hypothetical protein M1820_001998 [Bogoriella megaspora]